MAGGIERQAGVAAVWADAIVRLAAEADREDELLDELAAMVALLEREPELEGLLTSPIVDDEAKRKLL